jgi:hypothetical protein
MRKSVSGNALTDMVQPEIVAHVPISNIMRCEYFQPEGESGLPGGSPSFHRFPDDIIDKARSKAICLLTPDEPQSTDMRRDQVATNEDSRFDKLIQVVRRRKKKGQDKK